jgi:hypothetical protein
MKSNANSNPATRNPNTSSQPPSPSVPISVYRELAAELQATRAMVDSLNAKNQELTVHNQRLKQEIQRFVQSAMHLQVLVEPTQVPVSPQSGNIPGNIPGNVPGNVRRGKTQHQTPASLPTLEEAATASMIAAQLRSTDEAEVIDTELESQPPRPKKDGGGLWLMFIVMVIMVTAFGAGFLVVRPFLPTTDNEGSIDQPFSPEPSLDVSPSSISPSRLPQPSQPSQPSQLPTAP